MEKVLFFIHYLLVLLFALFFCFQIYYQAWLGVILVGGMIYLFITTGPPPWPFGKRKE